MNILLIDFRWHDKPIKLNISLDKIMIRAALSPTKRIFRASLSPPKIGLFAQRISYSIFENTPHSSFHDSENEQKIRKMLLKTSEGSEADLTPQKLVEYLDKFVIGQGEAKKAIACAFRNRWRRRTKISLQRYHCKDIATKISLQRYHCKDIATKISLQRYRCKDITAKISLQRYCYKDITAKISL